MAYSEVVRFHGALVSQPALRLALARRADPHTGAIDDAAIAEVARSAGFHLQADDLAAHRRWSPPLPGAGLALRSELGRQAPQAATLARRGSIVQAYPSVEYDVVPGRRR
jgi:hypothetical protein